MHSRGVGAGLAPLARFDREGACLFKTVLRELPCLFSACSIVHN
jgi:hypothetical protein